MSINLNDTTPAAVTGGVNVKWQVDSAGNVSAYTGLASTKTTVTPVAGVVTIDCSLGNSFWINVNAAITSMTLTNPTDGQEITIVWAQDGTGHSVVTATNLLGTFTITTTANKHSCYKWTYNSGDTNWYQVGVNNQ